jgi:carbamoyltransferase
MNILGITHPISWNNAACLIKDGELVAMAEEERHNRVKHAPRMIPERAIEYCLRTGGLSIDQIDHVAVGWDRPLPAALGNLRGQPLVYGVNFGSAVLAGLWLHTRRIKPKELASRLVFVRHHVAHAASAFHVSGFEDANIICLDGSGGSESGILGYGKGNSIEIFRTVSNAASWGHLYSEVTGVLGFRRHSAEGKVMGLAAYAEPDPDGFPFIDWDKDVPEIDYWAKRRYLSRLKRRRKDDPIEDEHKRLAATLQHSLERAGLRMVEFLYKKTGSRNLCLAGGVALNCSMNGKLLRSPYVDDIFIQPAAHDAGTALGAAVEVLIRTTGQRLKTPFTHAYWGPGFENAEIEAALRAAGVQYERCDDIGARVARLLADGKIVGWFQGRMEVGPRALGNRSILANPSIPEMKDIVNRRVKHREPWRPFAPSILEESIDEVVEDAHASPFMILAFQARKEIRERIVSAIHVDDSCRPQTVSRETNPRYWDVIKKFKDLTGIPAVLNTSFNDDEEPIVCTPGDAIATFRRCGMDALAIGDYLVLKA